MEIKPFKDKVWLSSPTMHGDEIKYVFDEITGAQADLIKITGKQYGSIGVVAPLRFCKVLKPNA